MTTSTQTQLRRGTTTQVNSMTPVVGELVVDTSLSQPCVGDGVTAGGIKVPTAKALQNQSPVYGTVGGSANAITLTNSPAVGGYVDGLCLKFKASSSNTAATTVAVDGLAAKNIKKMNNGALADLASGDIVAGGIYEINYDGTQFQVKALAEGPYSSGALKFLGSVSASSSTTIALTGMMSSTYDDYVVIMGALHPSTTLNLFLQASVDNGSTWDGGSGHYGYLNTINSGGTITGSSVSSTQGTLISAINAGTSGELKLFSMNGPGGFQTWLSNLVSNNHTISAGSFAGISSAINAIRFVPSTGNIASGTFKLYGIVKS